MSDGETQVESEGVPNGSQPDRRGPRTVKGLTDEQWAAITEAADKDKMRVGPWIYRAAMAYINRDDRQPSRALSPILDAPQAAIAGPQADHSSPQAYPQIDRVERLLKLTDVVTKAAALPKEAAAGLMTAVRFELKQLRS